MLVRPTRRSLTSFCKRHHYFLPRKPATFLRNISLSLTTVTSSHPHFRHFTPSSHLSPPSCPELPKLPDFPVPVLDQPPFPSSPTTRTFLCTRFMSLCRSCLQPLHSGLIPLPNFPLPLHNSLFITSPFRRLKLPLHLIQPLIPLPVNQPLTTSHPDPESRIPPRKFVKCGVPLNTIAW